MSALGPLAAAARGLILEPSRNPDGTATVHATPAGEALPVAIDPFALPR